MLIVANMISKATSYEVALSFVEVDLFDHYQNLYNSNIK